VQGGSRARLGSTPASVSRTSRQSICKPRCEPGNSGIRITHSNHRQNILNSKVKKKNYERYLVRYSGLGGKKIMAVTTTGRMAARRIQGVPFHPGLHIGLGVHALQ
jgi:hypothetical protein